MYTLIIISFCNDSALALPQAVAFLHWPGAGGLQVFNHVGLGFNPARRAATPGGRRHARAAPAVAVSV
jgi:hypothetical protein